MSLAKKKVSTPIINLHHLSNRKTSTDIDKDQILLIFFNSFTVYLNTNQAYASSRWKSIRPILTIFFFYKLIPKLARPIFPSNFLSLLLEMPVCVYLYIYMSILLSVVKASKRIIKTILNVTYKEKRCHFSTKR